MVINESTEEIASTDPVLGPTTSKRTAKTTVVAKDQETVVIGGIMQERTIESVGKVPILGDIPLLGYLFRETTRQKIKTNLLLFLTPYIIRDASDFRRIFEKKMAERQQFVEEFYGAGAGLRRPDRLRPQAGPLAKMNQIVLREEMQKSENGGPGLPGEQLYRPGQSGRARPVSRRTGPPPPADVAAGDLLQSGHAGPGPGTRSRRIARPRRDAHAAGRAGSGSGHRPLPTAPPSGSTQQPPSHDRSLRRPRTSGFRSSRR